jgi:hypothetical protein
MLAGLGSGEGVGLNQFKLVQDVNGGLDGAAGHSEHSRQFARGHDRDVGSVTMLGQVHQHETL